MNNTRKHSVFLVLGIFLLGACMRTPITSIPTVINNIAATLGVQATSLGILTTLPLICFGVFAPFVPIISRRLGNELTIAIITVILFIGSYMRIINQPLLFIGTILVGLAITFMNVLLPAIITDNMPAKIGTMTSLYTLSMTFFSVFGAGLSAPIAQKTSWQFVVQLISLIALITFIVWLPNVRFNRRDKVITASKTASVWQNKTAWFMLFYFGLASLIFYTLVAWLPTMAIAAGISANTASLLAGLFQLASVPTSFLMPILAVRTHNRTRLIVIAAVATLVGIVALMIPIHSVIYFAIINIILGLATAATFSLTMTMFGLKTKTPEQTRNLSGMAQSIGYLIAAVGPVLTGALQNMTHSWLTSDLFMLAVIIIFTICGIICEKREFIFD
ncbi:major facilitator superfamily transporter [Paucilactobacillus hokkaidonensis JCM 18461]|uniref:Major facilitator superfamily transporter n=2 Tax=Paucilactobacillus hokkaidonensis TaxID=1193095 RepID=A0A0A1H1K1_9LACO|nr:MFS transporter [Paucilactobacillus hokkaidonensis]BAP86606.1 major facilitator superfamily transporter [Paucilactobacillus hokkaidonensis JCM 18461]